ncbi:unnamed protein product [Schistosoma turkestanicum]|nr:unnamed protein product [Schistosoma turkestanicum]
MCTPIVNEKSDIPTINTKLDINQSLQTIKQQFMTTHELCLREQNLLQDPNAFEMLNEEEYIDDKNMIEKENIVDNYKKLTITDHELSNESTTIKLINQCSSKLRRPIYVQIVDSLHHN